MFDGPTARLVVARLRLGSGVILFVFVFGHLVNHSLGIFGLATMNAGLAVSVAPWHTVPGTILLTGAALTHMATALWSVYRRRTLRLPLWQLVQTVLGLSIPLILIGHVLATRGLVERYDVAMNYDLELTFLWVIAPTFGIVQTVAVFVVWIHGCIGLHGWLRLKRWYARVQLVAFALAIIVPVAALAGYVSGGTRVMALAEDTDWVLATMEQARFEADMAAWMQDSRVVGWYVIGAILVAVLAARALRGYWRGRNRGPRMRYRGQRVVDVAPGMTALEALRAAGIRHASVCGGRGRCSTCRVQIENGADRLPPPEGQELTVLRRIAAPSSVRLACQIRPTADLALSPLLPPTATVADAYQRALRQNSEERTVAILFADLRGFTRFSESRLPYDVVFVLNRFRVTMAEAIESAGGVINEFVGDGLMALFGIDGDVEQGCRNAVGAARSMTARLEQLNDSLRDELDVPLKIGIGIHVGPVIVGEMGFRGVRGITVVGDVVNTASRLEEMTKTLQAQVVLSDDVVRHGGITVDDAQSHEVEIRGRVHPLAVRALSADAVLQFGGAVASSPV